MDFDGQAERLGLDTIGNWSGSLAWVFGKVKSSESFENFMVKSDFKAQWIVDLGYELAAVRQYEKNIIDWEM